VRKKLALDRRRGRRSKRRREFSKLLDQREVVSQHPFTAKVLLQSQISSCRTENMYELSAR
jgi:hypothetical protein